MEYATFLALHERGWVEFEQRLDEAQRRPRQVSYEDLEFLAGGYRQILHDNGLAQARFPGTGAARRLSRLTVLATRYLYQERRDAGGGSPARFWTETLPRAFRRNAPNTGAAAFLFVLGALFGIGLAAVETSLATVLLGPRAVAGLRDGTLWTESLVHSVPPSVSSSAIARNNLGVALVGWGGGALLGLGSLYILFFNGFLVGALFGVTLHYSLAGRLLEFISAHGPLELTLIVVTAAAGLRMGRAIVEATDRPRGDVLRAAARDALVILLGCLPWFIPLGLIEGFISPATGVPPPVKTLIGLSMLALFLITAWNPFMTEEEKP